MLNKIKMSGVVCLAFMLAGCGDANVEEYAIEDYKSKEYTANDAVYYIDSRTGVCWGAIGDKVSAASAVPCTKEVLDAVKDQDSVALTIGRGIKPVR